jgi:transcriptional regulator with XRE-family HTH domain
MDWFKETLAKWIDETGLSKEEAARKLGVGRKSVSNYLNPEDKTIPSYLTAFALIRETGGNIERALPSYDPAGDTPNHARATIERLQHRVEFLESKIKSFYLETVSDDHFEKMIQEGNAHLHSKIRRMNQGYPEPEDNRSLSVAEEQDPTRPHKPPS